MSVGTLTIICDLVKNYLSLSADQVWIYNQKRNIPNDSRLYIVASLVDSPAYAVGKSYASTLAGLESTTHQHTQETIRLDLLSVGTDAIDRVNEVIGALSSDDADRACQINGMQIAPKPLSVRDTSAAEVTRNLFRMTIEFRVLRAYTQTKPTSYYDSFEHEIETERGTV
jgi:hypothetical protein